MWGPQVSIRIPFSDPVPSRDRPHSIQALDLLRDFRDPSTHPISYYSDLSERLAPFPQSSSPPCSSRMGKKLHIWGHSLLSKAYAFTGTHPADTRESEPTTTPPSNSTAMMVVCGDREDGLSEQEEPSLRLRPQLRGGTACSRPVA